MRVMEASREVVEVVEASTPVLRAPTAFSVLPLTSKSSVEFPPIGFDQIPSLQSAMCWTRRGDSNLDGLVVDKVRSFHSQHERRVVFKPCQ